VRAVLQLKSSHLLDRSLDGNPNCEREREREREREAGSMQA
jgi:hypothetical protein